MAGKRRARRMDLEEVLRQLLDAFFDPRLDAFPGGGIERGKARGAAFRTRVFLDLFKVIQRNVEPVPFGVFEFEVLGVVASGM